MEDSLQRDVCRTCTVNVHTVADCQSQSSECVWLRLDDAEFQDVFTLIESEPELDHSPKSDCFLSATHLRWYVCYSFLSCLPPIVWTSFITQHI